VAAACTRKPRRLSSFWTLSEGRQCKVGVEVQVALTAQTRLGRNLCIRLLVYTGKIATMLLKVERT